jgi:hypothetical protein
MDILIVDHVAHQMGVGGDLRLRSAITLWNWLWKPSYFLEQ